MENNSIDKILDGKSTIDLQFMLNIYGRPDRLLVFEKRYPNIKHHAFLKEVKRRLAYTAFEEAIAD